MRALSPAERRQVVKPIDAWWTVLAIDPVAVRILPLLRNVRWITPIGVTVLGGLFGVLAIVLFLVGQPLAAGIAYELRFLLDCVDGKLARLRGTTSSFGALLDVLLDVLLTTTAYAVVAELTIPSLTPLITGLALFEAWSRERAVAARAGRAGDDPPQTPRARRTRLAPAPSTVDVETLALFVVPVLCWKHEDIAIVVTGVMLALVCFGHIRFALRESLRRER
ncbi:MAG: CDP-alcohol phosphatidyltransferase family protein [Microthrixaceae bacterium]